MRRQARFLVAMALLVPACALAQQVPLGRLFLSPEQRNVLDERRRANLPDKPTPITIAPTTRLDGYVKRSHGKSTVFLDGNAIADGVRPEGLRVRRGEDPTRVRIGVGEQGRSVSVRVGQSVDRVTGEVKDALGSGEVRIERRDAASK